jgi:hypothetical protein
MADTLMDHPLERIVFPAARIESIRYLPGHCSYGDPGSNLPEADWIVSVRYYTFFALRGPRVIATCGARHAQKRW